MKKYTDVSSYIEEQPKTAQKLLRQLRSLVRKGAPKAEEKISYGMPGYKLNGMFIYFAAFKNHIGLYPMPSAVGKFKKELAPYKTAKATIQFPLDKPLPIGLIKKIIAFRLKEVSSKK